MVRVTLLTCAVSIREQLCVCYAYASWVCYEVCSLRELRRHHTLKSWRPLRVICHCTVERLSSCLKFANIQQNSRSCLLGLTVISVHLHSIYVDPSIFLHQW